MGRPKNGPDKALGRARGGLKYASLGGVSAQSGRLEAWGWRNTEARAPCPRAPSRPAASIPCARRAARRRFGRQSPDTNSPVDCSCLAKGRATGPARPARHGRRLRWPQGARFVTVSAGVRLGQPGLPHVLDQHAPAREHLHQPDDGRVQQRGWPPPCGSATSASSRRWSLWWS